jgi:hypothetical protein
MSRARPKDIELHQEIRGPASERMICITSRGARPATLREPSVHNTAPFAVARHQTGRIELKGGGVSRSETLSRLKHDGFLAGHS